ncbi:IreB family regulatory phosphoprotein [Anoxynatronum sibiricum]|uniref:UPF0297 protein AAIG11_02145 n=1 Tax=Anoxynatronum sibiricum TaxID=210623 RepID=A0ABU9VQI5_9CLOT
MSDQMNNTMRFSLEQDKKDQAREIITQVYQALEEKGYNPANQFIGYILSGDPSYITSHGGARSQIRKIERDEILEELLNSYIKHHMHQK